MVTQLCQDSFYISHSKATSPEVTNYYPFSFSSGIQFLQSFIFKKIQSDCLPASIRSHFTENLKWK